MKVVSDAACNSLLRAILMTCCRFCRDNGFLARTPVFQCRSCDCPSNTAARKRLQLGFGDFQPDELFLSGVDCCLNTASEVSAMGSPACLIRDRYGGIVKKTSKPHPARLELAYDALKWKSAGAKSTHSYRCRFCKGSAGGAQSQIRQNTSIIFGLPVSPFGGADRRSSVHCRKRAIATRLIHGL